MPEVFVGAGSNAAPAARLSRATAELTRRFGALRCSSVYRSAAAGAPAADYLNVVVALETGAAEESVRAALAAVEALAGRTRADATVCELDLDLLLYGSRVCAERRLPRPWAFTLPFVVVPLAELAPELRHPVTGERCAAAASRALARAAIEKTAISIAAP